MASLIKLLCQDWRYVTMRLRNFFTAMLLIILASRAFAGGVEENQVILDLIGGKFHYHTKEARMYALEYFEIFIKKIGNSVKSPTQSDRQWVQSEIKKIGKLAQTDMVNALGQTDDNPTFIQIKIENIVSNTELVASNIKTAKTKTDEAYWWVQLSQLLLKFKNSDKWPSILTSSQKTYVSAKDIRGNLHVLDDMPEQVNMVLLSLLSNPG